MLEMRIRASAPMLDDDSLDYFRQRERTERAAAKNAASEAARRAQQQLAQEYAQLLNSY